MSTLVPLLAHIGSPNNPWIGVMTVSAIVLAVLLLLLVGGYITIAAPGDLLLPLAVVVLIAGLAGTLGDAINDQGPWAVPIGLVALGVLLWAAFRGGMELSWTSRPFLAIVAVAAIASVSLRPVLENLWFPTEDMAERLPPLGDATMTAELVSGPDESGRFTIRVTVDGGTLGDGSFLERPEDPETELWARFDVGPVFLTPPVPEDCIAADPCTTADFEMSLPPGFDEDPPDTVVVHLYTADRLPFSPPLSASVQLFPDAA